MEGGAYLREVFSRREAFIRGGTERGNTEIGMSIVNNVVGVCYCFHFSKIQKCSLIGYFVQHISNHVNLFFQLFWFMKVTEFCISNMLMVESLNKEQIIQYLVI